MTTPGPSAGDGANRAALAGRLVLCGGGNGVHAMVPLVMARTRWGVDVYAPLDGEAERLREGIAAYGGIEALLPDKRLKASPLGVASDPAVAAQAEVMAVVTPAFAHASVLQAIAPHLRRGAMVGAIPARGGFEYEAAHVLRRAGAREATLFGLQTLPWACRIRQFGRQVQVFGEKRAVGCATLPCHRAPLVAARLAGALGARVYPVPNMLAITLGNVGQLIHPGIMYGLLRDDPQRRFAPDEVPLFYQSVTEAIADVLLAMSDEVQAARKALTAEYGPRLDLGEVVDLRTWLLAAYGDAIADPSTLASAFRTNRAYAGLKLPVRKAADGLFQADLATRYLTEDVPYGLVVTRAIASLAGVRTPAIDAVIVETGRWMGAEYLVDGELKGRDVGRTRVPGNYGIHDLDALLQVVVGQNRQWLAG